MANHLAVATTTEVLRRRLTDAIGTEFPGLQALAKRPVADDDQARGQVSIFLYRVSPNPGLRNQDLPTRDAEGRVVHRPTAALDLHYLISFAGDEQDLVPQRLLGLVVASLHSRPELSREEIGAASVGGWLGQSDLMNEIEKVKFSMSTVTLDDISKLWMIFPQVPYQLSVAYEASVVLIESDLAVREALRVQERGVDALPMRQPVIEAVNSGRPLIGNADLTFEITGKRLRGAVTLIRFDDAEPLAVSPASDTRILVPREIATTLGAGIHSVTVIHEVPLGRDGVPHRAVESDAYRFVLRPGIEIVPPDDGDTDIRVTFTPPLQDGQDVHLLLNELLDPPPEDRHLRFFTLRPSDAAGPAPWTERTFDASALPSGTYIVRARVDRAESPTSYAEGPGAPRPPLTVTLP